MIPRVDYLAPYPASTGPCFSRRVGHCDFRERNEDRVREALARLNGQGVTLDRLTDLQAAELAKLLEAVR